MRNAEEIRKRLDEVKKMKSYTEAINMLADTEYQIGLDACHERHELKDELTKLHVLILGNGDPENSIINRLGKLEDCMDEVCGKLDDISEALLGTMHGEKGLLYRINDVEEMKSDFKKAKWIAISIVIGQIIIALINLIGG